MPTRGDKPDDLDDAWAIRVSSGITLGSREALASLYEKRFDRLYRLVKSRTRRDDAFAIDCVHDAWLRVVHSLPQLGSLAALDAWLIRAALSAALDRLKADVARTRRETNRERTPSAADDDLLATLRDELARLTSDERSIIDLRFRRGLSLAAIARSLGIEMKAAEMRLRRALNRLRGRVEEARDE